MNVNDEFPKNFDRKLILFEYFMILSIKLIQIFGMVPLTSKYKIIVDSLSSKAKDVDDDIIIFEWVFLTEVTVIL